MNKDKIDIVVDFLNNKLDEQTFNSVECEIGTCIESGLALICFGDEIEQLINNNKNIVNNDLAIKNFLDNVKLTKQRFLEIVDILFETEENIKNFADIIIETNIVHLNFPKKLIKFLDNNQIELKDFTRFMIIDMSEWMKKSYHEDFDFIEWKQFWIIEMIKNW